MTKENMRFKILKTGEIVNSIDLMRYNIKWMNIGDRMEIERVG